MAIKTSIATPTANSYVSVASANTYFNARHNADAWNDISSCTTNTTSIREQKENLLIQATREIDRTYRFFGHKYNTGIEGDAEYQFLEFPRGHHLNADSAPIIKEEVKYATYEQALWILERTTSRKTEGGEVVQRPFIGREAYQYLKPFVNRQVPGTGIYSWQGGF